MIYGTIADAIGPHGPATPLLFSYRMQKYAFLPESTGWKEKSSFFFRENLLSRRCSAVGGGSLASVKPK